jgi:hypothetical protein
MQILRNTIRCINILSRILIGSEKNRPVTFHGTKNGIRFWTKVIHLFINGLKEAKPISY